MTVPQPIEVIQEQMRILRAELSKAEADYKAKSQKSELASRISYQAYERVKNLKLELRRLDEAAVILREPLVSFEDRRTSGEDA